MKKTDLSCLTSLKKDLSLEHHGPKQEVESHEATTKLIRKYLIWARFADLRERSKEFFQESLSQNSLASYKAYLSKSIIYKVMRSSCSEQEAKQACQFFEKCLDERIEQAKADPKVIDELITLGNNLLQFYTLLFKFQKEGVDTGSLKAVQIFLHDKKDEVGSAVINPLVIEQSIIIGFNQICLIGESLDYMIAPISNVGAVLDELVYSLKNLEHIIHELDNQQALEDIYGKYLKMMINYALAKCCEVTIRGMYNKTLGENDVQAQYLLMGQELAYIKASEAGVEQISALLASTKPYKLPGMANALGMQLFDKLPGKPTPDEIKAHLEEISDSITDIQNTSMSSCRGSFRRR